MRRVIVTGGNGFIGSSLIRKMVALGVEVHALVNDNHQRLNPILPAHCIHVLNQGVDSSADIVLRLQPDTIFHLAAIYAEPVSPKSVQTMLDGNLTLGAFLLFAATKCTPQPVFINTGTYWQFDKDSAYSPNTLYAATKHAFQNLLHFYRSKLGLECVTLVLYDTFGEADTRPKLWNSLTAAPAGTSFPLSPGQQTIHLVHIDDIVDAFLRAAELLHAHQSLEPIYSVPSLHPVLLRTLVEEFNTAGHLGLHLRWGELPYWEGQVLDPWVGDVLPGWTPQVEVLPALIAMARQRREPGSTTHPAEPATAGSRPA